MVGDAEMAGDRPEWFRAWFGEAYLELYPHRDEAEAEAGVHLFFAASGLAPGSRVLDVACGAGRHLRFLRQGGQAAVGLDLSIHLLQRAREASGTDPLTRADMRCIPFADASFDAVTSFFTSFGYFDSPEEDAGVAREIRRVLTDEGSFMLDFLNADRIRRDLVAEDVRIISGHRVHQARSIERDVVVKRIRIESDDGRRTIGEFEERVRLYDAEALESELARAGLAPQNRYGDYSGGAFTTDSPRLIIAGRST